MGKTRKQKARLRESKARARRWADEPGRASDFITKLRKFVKLFPNLTRVILFVRVSDRKQFKARSQETQRHRLVRAARKYGLEVIDIIIDVQSARRHSKRRELRRAFELAQEHHAFVLAYAMNRFVRSERHHSTKRPDAVPTKTEFEEVATLAAGVPMVTVLNPDMPEFEVRSRVTKLAKKYRGNPGGRPPKAEAKSKRRQSSNTKARRDFYFERCRELHEAGKTYRQIEAFGATWESEFDPPSYRTIAQWIKDASKPKKRRCASFSRQRKKS